MSTLQLSDCRSSSSLFCCQFEQITLTPFDVLLSTFFWCLVPIAFFRLFIDQVCNFFMCERVHFVLFQRNKCAMSYHRPSTGCYNILFFNYTRFNHLDQCIFRFRAATKKRHLNQLTHTPLYHQCQRCTCLNITDYYETEWVKMKRNLNFVTIKKHSAWTHRTSERLIFLFWFPIVRATFSKSTRLFKFLLIYNLQPQQNPCQCQYQSQYVTHT